jgi:hypothetical protein
MFWPFLSCTYDQNLFASFCKEFSTSVVVMQDLGLHQSSQSHVFFMVIFFFKPLIFFCNNVSLNASFTSCVK